MTVYFIGAGPGAPDLLTLRGRDLIARCPVCLYAGSLIPEAVIAHAPTHAHVVNTASLTLDQIIDEMARAHAAGKDVARLHSGDPAIYGAIAEQMARLRALDIPYEMVPGVPAFTAAAARLGRELTVPGLAQTVILTRTSRRSSPMPERETLETLAQARATLAIHLSVQVIREVTQTLIPFYGADCPAAVVYRATWPDERIIRAPLGRLAHETEMAGITRTALILVGPALGGELPRESVLYSKSRQRGDG